MPNDNDRMLDLRSAQSYVTQTKNLLSLPLIIVLSGIDKISIVKSTTMLFNYLIARRLLDYLIIQVSSRSAAQFLEMLILGNVD